MKIEDYNEYYIQGSDHYLIPKDIFKELFNEMINWKEESKKQKEVIDETINDIDLVIELIKHLCQSYYDIHKKYDKLQQENKQLKIQISAREEVCNRLESNWNKLKEYLNYKSERAVGEDEYVYDEIYNEMPELD